MSVQNRTFEFQQCVNNFDKLNKRNNLQNYQKLQQFQIQQQQKPIKKSKFSQQASIIAKDIQHVTDLLSKLALLAKRKPLFDDKPIEIGELTYVIKQDIFKIEQNIQNLQKFTKGDSSIQIDSQINDFSKNVLNLLNNKMKNISGEFKHVLEIRQKNEINNKQRQENFLSATSTNQSTRNASPLNDITNMNQISENPYMIDQQSQIQSSPQEFLSIPQQTQQLLLMEEQSGEYLQLRNRAVETIESTINEVGNLFQQLSTMVQEQGEQIQRIDENVEDIGINITGAQRELLKYYGHITNNRWLFLKIFAVLVVFFLLWVLVS